MINNIHPTSIIGENVELGENNYIGPYCVITGNTVIGNNNVFVSHCSIGQEAEHKFYFGKDGETRIGNNNRFSEFVTVHRGTKKRTFIFDNNIFLRGSYIGHDSVVGSNITISCNVLIGGNSIIFIIFDGANLGLGSIIHQFQVIGHYSMLGMGSIVSKNTLVEPGNIYVGNPAKFLKKNEIGLSRNNILQTDLDTFQKIYFQAKEGTR